MVEANTELTRKTAELANLELTEQEVSLYASQLKEILGYVEQLNSVDVKAVEPLTHPLELTVPFREDVVRPFPPSEDGSPKVLASAPDVCDGSFRVPPIL